MYVIGKSNGTSDSIIELLNAFLEYRIFDAKEHDAIIAEIIIRLRLELRNSS